MIRLGFALVMTITLLAACGLKGELERPVPLFGNPPNEGENDPRTIRAKEQAEAKRKADEAAASLQPATPAPMPDLPQ
jgi:predicted small lipoprotein YifL